MISEAWAALAVAALLAGAPPAEAPNAAASAWVGRDYVCVWDAYWVSRPEDARRAYLAASPSELKGAAATLFSDRTGVAAAIEGCGKTAEGMDRAQGVQAFGSLGVLTYSEQRLIADHGLSRARLDAAWATLPAQLTARLEVIGMDRGAAAEEEKAAEEAVDALAAALSLPPSAVAESANREMMAFYILSRVWTARLKS